MSSATTAANRPGDGHSGFSSARAQAMAVHNSEVNLTHQIRYEFESRRDSQSKIFMTG